MKYCSSCKKELPMPLRLFEDFSWRRVTQVSDQWVKVGPWDRGGIFPILPPPPPSPPSYSLPHCPINPLTSWFSSSHIRSMFAKVNKFFCRPLILALSLDVAHNDKLNILKLLIQEIESSVLGPNHIFGRAWQQNKLENTDHYNFVVDIV